MCYPEIMERKIEVPEFSPEFCDRAKKMGFTTIGEVVALPSKELQSKEDFTFGWLAEFSEYLSNNGLLRLLQPIPGRKYD